MTSRERHRLQFCLNFVDQAPFIPTAAEWPTLVRTWIGYFQQLGYVRVNGKPLFIIFSPEQMHAIFGSSAGVHQALDYLRAQARAAGLPGVTVAIATTVAPNANPIRIQELNSEGYDATTGYSYHSLGGEQYRIPVPYDQLVAENTAEWDRVAARIPLPYIPVITSGFDLRYSIREQQTAIIYEGRTPQKFACYAVLARHWVDTHPQQTTAEHIVMVYAWTEMGEGGAIIPSRQDGYDYVEALRQVFGGPGEAPSTPSYCR
jgi:Glycosyltransferase WbsX